MQTRDMLLPDGRGEAGRLERTGGDVGVERVGEGVFTPEMSPGRLS